MENEELTEMAREELGYVNLVDLDEDNKELTIYCSYKTGDGIDNPYDPTVIVDEGIIAMFEAMGFTTDTEGTMIYPIFRCPKCKKQFEWFELIDKQKERIFVDEESEDQEKFRCLQCNESLLDVRGSKFIYGTKTIKLEGMETQKELEQIILGNLR